MGKTAYNSHMAIDNFDNDLCDVDFSKFSRQEIHQLMLDIDEDVKYLQNSYAPPKLIRHHHELLSKLVKRYGH